MTQERDMANEADDPLLDSLLDEVYGAQSPPDLKAQILAAMRERGVVGAQSTSANAPFDFERSETSTVSELPSIQSSSRGNVGRHKVDRSNRRLLNILLAAAACMAVAVGLTAWLNQPTRTDIQVVETVGGEKESDATSGNGLVSLDNEPEDESGVDAENWDDKTDGTGQLVVNPISPATEDKDLPRSSSQEIVGYINDALARGWQQANVKVAKPVDDDQWCERVYQRLLGRSPNADEVAAFADSSSTTKREQLVDTLLTDASYRGELASNWATVWSEVLVSSGEEKNAVYRTGLKPFLSQAFSQDVPYDQLVQQLITAEGSNKKGATDFNAATNFLLADLDEKSVAATERVSHAFLGREINCAQCHDHPTKSWGQNQFWEMNAFFRQMRSKRDGENIALANVDFGGEAKNKTPDRAEIYYQQPDQALKTAFPRFLDRETASTSGRLADVDRRLELSQLVTGSPEFSQTLVNQLWSHFMGRGLAPLRDSGEAANPELLQRLSSEFVAYQYNLKDVMKWVVLSDAFGLSSDGFPDGRQSNRLFAQYMGDQPASIPLTDSITMVAVARRSLVANPSGDPGATAVARVAADLSDETKFAAEDILRLKDSLGSRVISEPDRKFLKRLDQSKLSSDQKIQHLFQAALARDGSKAELAAMKKMFANPRRALTVLEDSWWTLLQSDEYHRSH